MTLSGYIDGMSSGILKQLFTMLDKFISTCTMVYEYGTVSIREILVDILENFNVPDYQVNIINKILKSDFAWMYNITLLDILFGIALIAVVVFGFVKYFTDIVL